VPVSAFVQISVVIPAFNSAATICEALTSVKIQTLRPAETIVVDDASSDDTAHTAETLLSRDSMGRVIRLSRNSGPASARNAGVEKARGEWIAFLDADDVWTPHRLATQARLIARYPDVAFWCGQTVPVSAALSSSAPDSNAVAVRPLPLDEFADHNPVATSTVMVRKNVLDRVGGFDPQFRGPEDFDLWMRIATGHSLMFIEAPLAGYRFRAGSLSMDDCTFLRQVLGVLDKAFGPGGAMSGRSELRPRALSTQYWNASWMAFHRGSRTAAIAYWLKAFQLDRRADRPARRRWLKLLARYLVGRTEA
jgi:glycosyltransferase involved in cell wall biosynthesis